MVSYEDLITHISGNGRYQGFLVFLSQIIGVTSAFMSTAAVFILALPPSRCRITGFDDQSNLENIDDAIFKKYYIPWNAVTQDYDRCHQFRQNVSSCENNATLDCFLNAANSTDNVEIVSCTDGYVFDRSTFEETITTEWNLVCEDLIYMTLSSSTYYFGLIFGGIIGGMLADRFGRRLVAIISCFLSFCCGMGLAFSPSVSVVIFLRFLLAICFMPSTVALFVYANEISKKSVRTCIGALANASFGLGCILTAVVAYRWQNWRNAQIAFSMSILPSFFCCFFLTKSPRWLLCRGKIKECQEVSEKMAKRNQAKIPEEMFDDPSLLRSAHKEEEQQISIIELFKRPLTRFMLICNCLVWLITSMVYYGVLLNGGSLAGSIYVNHALGGVIEAIACVVSVPLIMKFGRRSIVVITLGIASITCLLSTLVTQINNRNEGEIDQNDSDGSSVLNILGIVLSMIGRLSSSATFAVIYQHTAELFPTPGRGTALGASSTSARLGVVFAPFTLQLQYDIPWLTPTIFGIAAMFGAVIASILPETKDSPLLSSFDEAEKVFQKHLKGSLVAKIFCLPAEDERNDDPELKPMKEEVKL